MSGGWLLATILYLIPLEYLNSDTGFISFLWGFRAAVLCAMIVLHTADAASASGLFHLSGSIVYLSVGMFYCGSHLSIITAKVSLKDE